MSDNALFPLAAPVQATVSLPGSKSITNRALILAALARGESVLDNVLFSADSEAALAALSRLGVGLHCDRRQGRVQVIPAAYFADNISIDARDAGTVARFLLPCCAARGGYYCFSASARMCERPMADLLAALAHQGVSLEFGDKPGHLPLCLRSGGLSGGVMYVAGDASSQFLSGLLMAAPYARHASTLISNAGHQQPYVLMTCAIMKAFGVAVHYDNGRYEVPARQHYQGRYYAIEPDVSTASYFWAAAALTAGTVTVRGVHRSALQGDIRFLEVLEHMGCQVLETPAGIQVCGPRQLRGVSVNMRSFSDTFMTVAVLAAFAEGPTLLSGLAHTRAQESDRIACMAEGLARLGVAVTTTADTLHIQPGNELSGATVRGCNDHRIAMALALAGLKLSGVVVQGAECVAKTCPDYFARMHALSGNVSGRQEQG